MVGGAFSTVRAEGNNWRRVASTPPLYYSREPPGALLNTASPLSTIASAVPPLGRFRELASAPPKTTLVPD